jgi:hypothetical protein
MEQFNFSQDTTLLENRVDKEKGVIYGVSVISTPEAKGHGVKIDNATIQSFYEHTQGKSIKAYYTHDEENEALDAIGLWENFQIVEGEEYTKLTADFVALEAFRNHKGGYFDALFELAEKAPEAFGVSAEFFASRVFYNDDGEEQEYKGEEGVEVYARAVEVSAFSIVAMPSANPTGLFSINASVEKEVEVEDEEIDVEEFLSFNLNKTQEDLKGTEQELKLSQDANAVLSKQNNELSEELKEANQKLEELSESKEAVQKELDTWQIKYARAVADMGSEPVEFSTESAPLSFSEKLASCKTWEEKNALFKSNMSELLNNPDWAK